MRGRCLLGLFLAVAPAFACPCMVSYSACNAARVSNLVFAGTVESIEPRFMNRWTSLSRSAPGVLDEISRWESDPSPDGLAKLKAAYLKLVPDLPEPSRRGIEAAKTSGEAMLAVFRALDRTVQIRFRVSTVFHAGKDDDDGDKKDDDDRAAASMKSVVISTDSGECGFEFMPGETYLVYASNDEQSGSFVTGKCSRTKRLSDAGEDLAYLYFLKNGGTENARLEGFVTSDRREMDQDRFRYTGKIAAPVSGTVIEVKSDAVTRFAEVDANGRFLLDGLAEGDYSMRAFEPGYPVWVRQVSGPATLHVAKGQCAGAVLLAPARVKEQAP